LQELAAVAAGGQIVEEAAAEQVEAAGVGHHSVAEVVAQMRVRRHEARHQQALGEGAQLALVHVEVGALRPDIGHDIAGIFDLAVVDEAVFAVLEPEHPAGAVDRRLGHLVSQSVSGFAPRPARHDRPATASATARVARTTTADAAAMVGSNSERMPSHMRRGRVRIVGLPMKSEISSSSNEVRKASSAPERTPGRISGRITVMVTRRRLAPSDSPARKSSGSRPLSEASVVKITKGSASVRWPTTRPA